MPVFAFWLSDILKKQYFSIFILLILGVSNSIVFAVQNFIVELDAVAAINKSHSQYLMNVLITGAAGYLGSIVLKKMQEDLNAGTVKTLVCTDLRELAADKRLKSVIYEQADIRDGERMKEICLKYRPQVILHLAAVLDSQSMPREIQYQIDVEGTKKLLDAALESGCKRIIISSSGAAYGYYADNPEWLRESDPVRGNKIFAYSDHKRLVEEILAEYRAKHPQLEQTIFRIGTILGAKTDNLITALFKKKRILGLKGFKSPFVFIWDEDAAACLRQAIFSDKSGIYNLVGDGALANKDLAQLLGKPYREMHPGFLRIMLSILQPLGLSKYGPEQLLFLQYRPVLDNTKLKEVFGFKPVKTSLDTFCFYLKSIGIEPRNISKINVLRNNVF
jgi:UDP-glucose 4-epimerase